MVQSPTFYVVEWDQGSEQDGYKRFTHVWEASAFYKSLQVNWKTLLKVANENGYILAAHPDRF